MPICGNCGALLHNDDVIAHIDGKKCINPAEKGIIKTKEGKKFDIKTGIEI
jgi:hypothetical protein